MNPEVKAKWIAALRSGQYQQGAGRLRSGGNKFCCMGVLCDLAEKEGIVKSSLLTNNRYGYGNLFDTAYLPAEVVEWAGLSTHQASFNPSVLLPSGRRPSLSDMNDSMYYTFDMIADAVEAGL